MSEKDKILNSFIKLINENYPEQIPVSELTLVLSQIIGILHSQEVVENLETEEEKPKEIIEEPIIVIDEDIF